jgi:hypothetical protein
MKRIAFLLLPVLLLTALAPFVPLTSASASVTGASFTTVNTAMDGSGHCANGSPTVNCNLYDGKRYVWLNGGPVASALGRDGQYFFAVLAPSNQATPNDGGSKNLSDDYDAYTNRTFTIKSGKVSSYSGSHSFNKTLIRLFPYADTPNPGGVYILAICSLAHGYPVKATDCKYDQFKVMSGTASATPTVTPTSSDGSDCDHDGGHDPGDDVCTPTSTPTETPTNTPTNTPTATPTNTPPGGMCTKVEQADFTTVPLGASVTGMGVVAPDLNITAAFSADHVQEGVDPVLYGANLNGVHNSEINGGIDTLLNGFGDLDAHTQRVATRFTFTFTSGMTATEFKLHMLDFGDWNPQETANHKVTVSAFNASNVLVDQQTLEYTTPITTNHLRNRFPTSSDKYGNMQVNGDALQAAAGMPGNWFWDLKGTGITRVTFNVGGAPNFGPDPNFALDELYITVQYKCP